MVDPVTLQMVRDVVAIFGVIAGFTYYVLTVRNSQRTQRQQLETRQAQLFMQLYSLYDTKDFMEDYAKVSYIFQYEDLADWQQKYGVHTNLPAYASWARIGRYFDGVGILVKKNMIDVNLVTELLREPVIYSWENMRPWVYEMRDEMDTPEVWENFEYLYEEVRKRHPQTTPYEDLPSTKVVARPEP